MKQIKYIVAALLVTSLSGCGVRPTYQREIDDNLVDNLYDYIEASADNSNLASVEWRDLFNDPYLQGLIEQGLEANIDLNIARKGVEQAEISLGVARKAFLPSLAAAASAGVASNGGSTAQSYNVELTSSWEVDLFGRLRNAKEASRAALEQSVAYRQAVQTQLIASIAGCYYSLIMLDDQLAISEATQENWQENLRVMRAMKSAGRINETSVLQSEASSIALSSQIVTIKESIAELENSLSLLLGAPAQTIERGEVSYLELPESVSVGVPMQLLGNRPDVKMAESALVEAFYTTAEARSSLYPSIVIAGAAGYSGDMLLSLMGSIIQPIFSHGELKAQVEISESQQQQALLGFTQSLLEASTEVNNALCECQSAQQRLIYTEEQIVLLEQVTTKTELLMKYGSATSLEVLTAQLSLLQTELSRATERYNQAQGVINLYRALGGGVQ